MNDTKHVCRTYDTTSYHFLKLPRIHTRDWYDRCGESLGAEMFGLGETPLYVYLKLTCAALNDLIQDAVFYVSEMHGEYADGVDHRPAARRVLKSIHAQLGDVAGGSIDLSQFAPTAPTIQ